MDGTDDLHPPPPAPYVQPNGKGGKDDSGKGAGKNGGKDGGKKQGSKGSKADSPRTASRSADTSCPMVGARRGRNVPFPTTGLRSRSKGDAGSADPCIT